ncbi:MAG TPA: GNAT family N-acetyltransferase, partial [Dongiaceae bacterium]
MKIALREARPVDYGFARQLYRATMHDMTEEAFGWDEYRQDMSFARQFILKEVRVITLDGKDIGWIQTRAEGAVLNLFQFYVAPEWQGRGIGGFVLKRLMGRRQATRKNDRAISDEGEPGDPALSSAWVSPYPCRCLQDLHAPGDQAAPARDRPLDGHAPRVSGPLDYGFTFGASMVTFTLLF